MKIKTFIQKSVGLIILVSLFISCSKDNDSTNPINIDAGIVSHDQVAEITLPTENLSQNIYDGNINGTPIKLVKSGINELSFYMPNDLPVGDYNLLIPALDATISVQINQTVLTNSADETMSDFFTNLTTYSQTIDTSTPEGLSMSQAISSFSNFYNNSNQEQKDAFALIYKANKTKFDNFTLNIDAGKSTNSFFSNLFSKTKKATFSIALGTALVVVSPVLGGATAVAAGVFGVLLAKQGCERAYEANKELIDYVYDDISVKFNGFFGSNIKANENLVLVDNTLKQMTFQVSRRKIIASDESKTTPLAIDYFDSYKRYNELTGKINQTIENLNNSNTIDYGDVAYESLPTSSPEVIQNVTSEMFSNVSFSLNNSNLSLQQATFLSDGQLNLKALIVGNPSANSISTNLTYSYDNDFSEFSGTISLRVDRSLEGTWKLESFNNGIPVGQYQDLFSSSCPTIVYERFTYLNYVVVFNSDSYTDNSSTRYLYLNKTITPNCIVQSDAADTVEDYNDIGNGSYVINGNNIEILNQDGDQINSSLVFISNTKIKIDDQVFVKQ